MSEQQFLLEPERGPQKSGPVTCLGLSFPDEAARRAHFTALLAEKLKDPEFRKIEGFPLGTDEAILALSDPPYYTACPNPWIADFIAEWEAAKPTERVEAALPPQTPPAGEMLSPALLDRGKSPYHREPFAADVSEGKNDPIYNAHSYHTKVPHKAIMRYILHYTEPGDIVFDGFCGTGMTGVAAQMCGDRDAVLSLGYQVQPDGAISREEEGADGKKTWKEFSRLGARRAVLNDLSPAATFIAYNYNTPVDVREFEREARRILQEVEAECGWMYETAHTDGRKGIINYTVWSDVFVCPYCSREIVFWNEAVDKEAGQVREEFPCPQCGANLSKRSMDRAWVTRQDADIEGGLIRQARQAPVLINYSVGKKRFEKTPDAADLGLIERIERERIPYWYPTARMMEGQETRRNDPIGITHVHHFYTKRSLWVLASLYSKAKNSHFKLCTFLVQYAALGFSKISRYVPTHFSQVNQYLSGTLYIGSQQVEVSPNYILNGKLDRLIKREAPKFGITKTSILSCGDASKFDVNSESFDYIFIAPPLVQTSIILN